MKKIASIILLLASGFLCIYAQSLHTTDVVSEFDKGRMMYLNGNYTGCLDIMQLMLRRDEAAPYYEEAAFYIAMSQARRGSDRTEIELKNYLQEYPFTIHRHEILLALGDYYYSEGDYVEALERYSEIDMNNISRSDRDNTYYNMAFCYIKMDETQKALPMLKVLIQKSPKYRDEARFLEGYIYYKDKNYSEAYRSLSRVNSGSRYDYETQYLIANIDFLKNNYAQNIAQSEQLLSRTTNMEHKAELHRMLGDSHYELGNDLKADEHFTHHLQLVDVPSRITLYKAGIIAYRNAHYSRAIELLSQTTDSADYIEQNAQFHIGLSYLQERDMLKASQAFEKAASSQFDKGVTEMAMYNEALCCYESNLSLFDSTISLFEKFLSEYPQSVYADEAKQHLSYLYRNSRNYQRALDYIDNIKKPMPETLKERQIVLYMLGTEAFANNSISRAGEWFTQAIKAGKYAPEYRARAIYWLGECCYRSKAYKEALKCYNQFLSIPVATDPEIVALAHYSAGYCHFKMKDYDKALKSFNKYIQQTDIKDYLLVDVYNRMGDCYFRDKKYDSANDCYALASDRHLEGSDYALLQQAIIAGASKKNSQKIELLEQLVNDYPQSEYGEEAYNEMGQTYIALNKPMSAIETFQKIVDKNHGSLLARKARLQIGALYYNNNDIEPSIASYRALIEQHPSCNESKIAAEELKSIYVEINKIDEFSNFMQQYGMAFQKSELDSLSYIAAERRYIKHNNPVPLKEYVAQYPQGNYAAPAYFYLGNVADADADEDLALIYYQRSLKSNPDSEFAEDALIRCSDILYKKDDYAQAIDAYSSLETHATTVETRQTARLGVVRCSAKLQHHEQAIEVAGRLLSNSNLSPEIKQEALYHRATALSALGKSQEAYNDYLLLAEDTRSVYGAEGAYRVADYLLQNNEIEQAEQAANNFIKEGTTHAYWLARNFILLSDIYVAKDDLFTARQYLVQLQENYPGSNDDIAARIEEKLQSINSQQEKAQ